MEDSGPRPPTWQEGHQSLLQLPRPCSDPRSDIEWLGNSLPTRGLVSIGHGSHDRADSSQLFGKDVSCAAPASVTASQSFTQPLGSPEQQLDTDAFDSSCDPSGLEDNMRASFDDSNGCRSAALLPTDDLLAAFLPGFGGNTTSGSGTGPGNASAAIADFFSDSQQMSSIEGDQRNTNSALRPCETGSDAHTVPTPDSCGWVGPQQSVSLPSVGSLGELQDEESMGLWPSYGGSLSPVPPCPSGSQGCLSLPSLAALQASMGAPSSSREGDSSDGTAQQGHNCQVQSIRNSWQQPVVTMPDAEGPMPQCSAPSQKKDQPASAFSPVQLSQQQVQQQGAQQVLHQCSIPQQPQQPGDTGQQDVGAPGRPAAAQQHKHKNLSPLSALPGSHTQPVALSHTLAAQAWQQLHAQQWAMAQHMYSMGALAAAGPSAYGWMSQQLPQPHRTEPTSSGLLGSAQPPSVLHSSGLSPQLPSVLMPAPDLRPISMQLSAGMQQLPQHQAAFLQMQQMHQMQAMWAMQQAAMAHHAAALQQQQQQQEQEHLATKAAHVEQSEGTASKQHQVSGESQPASQPLPHTSVAQHQEQLTHQPLPQQQSAVISAAKTASQQAASSMQGLSSAQCHTSMMEPSQHHTGRGYICRTQNLTSGGGGCSGAPLHNAPASARLAGSLMVLPRGTGNSRAESLGRYREKRARRLGGGVIRYHACQAHARRRPRIKGRFATRADLLDHLASYPKELGGRAASVDLDSQSAAVASCEDAMTEVGDDALSAPHPNGQPVPQYTDLEPSYNAATI